MALSTEKRRPWSSALVVRTVQKTGNNRIDNEPPNSATGSRRIVNATPNRCSAVAVSVSCTMKLTIPSAKLKVPKNRVSAPASPLKRSSATTFNWNALHWVEIATRNTVSAISLR